MTFLTATFPDGTTSQLAIDAVLNETPHNAAVVTEHPVERGANVADHIRPAATTLALVLVVSNTPLERTAATQGGFARDRAERTYAQLVSWQEAGALLSILTTLGPRTSYAITGISTPRDAKTGGPPGRTGGLRISVQLKQVRIVQNKLTRVVVSKDRRNGRTVKTGKQATKKAPPSPPSYAQNSALLDIGTTLSPAAQKLAKVFGF